jgi:hypothetical protein
MDEIFGRGNFLNDIIWNSTKSVTNTAIISVSHTHSLVFTFPAKLLLRVCRAKRLLPLMIRLSLIKPFSLRLKFTSSLTPFWVYFLAE